MSEAKTKQKQPRNGVGTGELVRPDRTNRAHAIADTLCRRIYGTGLEHSGGRMPELLADAFAVLNALDKLETRPNAEGETRRPSAPHSH